MVNDSSQRMACFISYFVSNISAPGNLVLCLVNHLEILRNFIITSYFSVSAYFMFSSKCVRSPVFSKAIVIIMMMMTMLEVIIVIMISKNNINSE